MSKSIHTTIISIMPVSEINSAIIEMHDPLYKNHLQSPSTMLANKHVLYLYYLGCGGGGWNAIRYKILDPLKIKYQIPPKFKYKSYIWLKKVRYLTKKNKLDITPPLKIKYQIARYPRSTPPPPIFVFLFTYYAEWFVCV